MKPGILRAIYLTIAVVFWLILSAYHGMEIVVESNPVTPWPMRIGDLGYRLVMIGFLLFIALFFERLFSNIEKLEVTTLLWRLFITGMGGVALIMLVTFANRATTNLTFYPYLRAIYFSLTLFALVLFFLSSLFMFRRFVLYPRTRQKIILWRILLGFMVAALVFQVLPLGLIVPLSYIPFLILCLILSANVRWISYLNFGQKLRALGLFSLIGLVITTFLIAGARLPEQLGLPLERIVRIDFLYFAIIFTIAYTLVSILVLFFNLPTSSLFEKEGGEVISFAKINQAIKPDLNPRDLMENLLNLCLTRGNSRVGWVELLGEEGEPNEIIFTERINEAEVMGLAQREDYTARVIQDRKPILIRNLKKQGKNQGLGHRYRSLLAIPILSPAKIYGIVFLVSELTNAFEDESVKAVGAFGEQAGIALENVRLMNESIELERYQAQLKIAQRVQRDLLPQKLPQSDSITFAARADTAMEVGGDYFDVVVAEPGLYRVAIGDVSGKGTTAAFYMAETKGIFHALARQDLGPAEFISVANQALSECMEKGFFMTMTYLEIEEAEKKIKLVRAGHCPTLYYRASTSGLEMLEEGTLGLGIIRNHTYANLIQQVTEIDYAAGDMVILYTDGIHEARNQHKEEFGLDRLQDLVASHLDHPPEELAELLIQSVKDFAQSDLQDDYTVLIIKFG